MVDVVQLVEHQVVILAVAGSSPVIHPEEQLPPPASQVGAVAVSRTEDPCATGFPFDSFVIT